MRKKTIILTALLLLLFVESAVAVPKNQGPKPKVPKPPRSPKIDTISFVEQANLDAGNIYLGTQEIIDTGILQVQNAISTGIVSTGESPISGFNIETTLSGTCDLNTFEGNYEGDWILTGQGGSFEGSINGKVEVASISGRFNSKGTGLFEGQKLKGSFEGQVNDYKIEIIIKAIITSKNT